MTTDKEWWLSCSRFNQEVAACLLILLGDHKYIAILLRLLLLLNLLWFHHTYLWHRGL